MPTPDEDRLRRLWNRTLGPAAVDDERLSPHLTYRPPSAPGPSPDGTVLWAGVLPLPGSTATTPTVPGGATSASVTAAAAAAAGTRAPYELGEELGRGGMGVVQRARQSSLGRVVALKRMLPGTVDLEARARFVAEALVTARLDHPNVVPVHDLSVQADGNPFLAMKLVSGTPWSRLLHPKSDQDRARAASLDRDGHLDVLASVCNGVAYAHSRGVLHRDLKPENVMVGEFGEVLVMDWGVAAEFGAAAEAERVAPHVSSVDAAAGTPSYMAPELADARGEEQGPWTDVYLLGAILHEVLVGEPPHRGGSFWRVLAAASESAPPSFPPSVPEELQAICRKAMAARPADRYPTVVAFQAALGAYRRHRESVRVSDGAQAALEAGRRAAAQDAAATATVYASLAEALALARQARVLWDGNEAAARCEAAARAEHVRAALAAGDVGLARVHERALPQGSAERAELAPLVDAAEGARARATRTARILKAAVAALALLLVAGAVLFGERQAAANAELRVAHEKERRARHHQEELRERAEGFLEAMVNELSQELQTARRPDLVARISAKASEYYDGLGPEDVPGGAGDGLARRRSMMALNEAQAHQARGDLGQAVAAYERAIEIARGAKREDDETSALALLGTVLEEQGNVDAARDRFERAVALARKGSAAAPGDDWWRGVLANAALSLARLEVNHGRPAVALAAAHLSRDAAARSLEAAPTSAHALQRLALALETAGDAAAAQGDSAAALASYRESVAALERLSLPAGDRGEWPQVLARVRERVRRLEAARPDQGPSPR